MMARFLDVVVVSFDRMLQEIVEENFVLILLLLIALLVAAAFIVNAYVLKKNKPSQPDEKEDREKEGSV